MLRHFAAKLEARLITFVERLRERPETEIFVFGHADAFNCLLENHFGKEDYWMDNCEVVTVTLEAASDGS